MILGVGTDLVSVARLAEVVARQGDRFLERVLSPEERASWPTLPEGQARFLARRWAAKEAFAKAYGTGIRGEVALNAVIVGHDPLGKPQLSYAGQLAKKMDERRLHAHLSISDEHDYALAFVVIESDGAS
jgi:holo-[acyl-carrier protein] synthase